MYRLKIWIKVVFSFFISFRGAKNAIFLTSEETVASLLKSKKSLIRIGDGEFNLLDNRDVHYQKWSQSIKDNLTELIDEYIDSPQKTNYILCMPRGFFNCNGFKLLERKEYVTSWSISRRLFNKMYDVNTCYGDSFTFAEGNLNIYEKIWTSSEVEHIVFVHNNVKYFDEFKKRYSLSSVFISIPEKNAYLDYDQIINEIENAIAKDKESMVLISAGPTAKILVRDLSRNNIWAIDTGHCWDAPLNDPK